MSIKRHFMKTVLNRACNSLSPRMHPVINPCIRTRYMVVIKSPLWRCLHTQSYHDVTVTLQKQYGIDLHQNQNAINIITCLSDANVSQKDILKLFNDSSDLLRYSADSVREKVNKFNSFGFSGRQIVNVLQNHLELIEMDNSLLSQMFEMLQQLGFSSSKISQLIVAYPHLMEFEPRAISKQYYRLGKLFNRGSLNKLIENCPSLLTDPWTEIEEKAYYITEEMDIEPEELIAANLFWYDFEHIVARHECLVRAGLFDVRARRKISNKEDLLKLSDIVGTSDVDFCQDIASIPLDEYKVFVKMIRYENATQREYDRQIADVAGLKKLSDLDDEEFDDLQDDIEDQIMRGSYNQTKNKHKKPSRKVKVKS